MPGAVARAAGGYVLRPERGPLSPARYQLSCCSRDLVTVSVGDDSEQLEVMPDMSRRTPLEGETASGAL